MTQSFRTTKLCVEVCAWVRLIFSVSRLLIMCLDAQESTTNALSSRFRVDAGRHLSLEGEKNVALSCSLNLNRDFLPASTLLHSDLALVTLSRAGAMQQYPESHHLCTEAVQQCPEEDKASGSSRSSYLRTSIRGFHRVAPREHHGRSFWRETWR